MSVPPGEYPVAISVGLIDDGRDRRVTAARLTVRPEPAVSWELALWPGQDARKLGEDEFYGFAVDAGMGCFCDASAVPALSRHPLYPDDDGTLSWEVTDPESGANMIAYASGWGDGVYPTWIGRDEHGSVVAFISDMLVVEEEATVLR